MNKSESIKELATALCKFQGEVEKIKKTETNPFFKNKYADLSSILDVIRNPLSSNGLSFVQFPVGKCELETILMHTSGEWMSATYEMKPTKDDPQGAGSVITYQRRYALGAILGLNIDVDDDGNKGSEEVKHKSNGESKYNTPPSAANTSDEKILIQAMTELENCKTVEQVTSVWNKYPKLHSTELFVKEVSRLGKKFKQPVQ